ncbi:zinc finger HIT domain-containing protein 3 [Orussus abietinus]|uniref:zinc finger HIT domain-containing protein 3 n=1 Tax=Orussus abietinus TaxID=222816 RepID=UPI00062610F4|nr:zinc finger HIT domain-containing protein 3 [Orussus abietinus]
MTRSCHVCKSSNAPYKCPVCLEPYCSLGCCKTHKSRGCERRVPDMAEHQSEAPLMEYKFPTEDTVPVEKLFSLRQSEEVKHCLKNPHVRNIIKEVLKHQNPTDAIAEAMVEPIFVELADACLKIVEPATEEGHT